MLFPIPAAARGYRLTLLNCLRLNVLSCVLFEFLYAWEVEPGAVMGCRPRMNCQERYTEVQDQCGYLVPAENLAVK